VQQVLHELDNRKDQIMTICKMVLASFNNRQLTRDLLAVCQRVNELQPKLPDGRLLILHAPSFPFGRNPDQGSKFTDIMETQ